MVSVRDPGIRPGNVIDGEVVGVSGPVTSASPRSHSDLNQVRDRLLASQQGSGATGTGLYVDPAGKVMLREQAGDVPARSLSAVTGETFYAPGPQRHRGHHPQQSGHQQHRPGTAGSAALRRQAGRNSSR
jgi:hypothetical protein